MFDSCGDGGGIGDILRMMDILNTRRGGPRGTRQKNLQNWDSMNRRRRMKIMVAYFIYTVLVIDHCAWEMVKISPACRALTISL